VPQEQTINYYDVLQVSANAEPETIHRVYRMLAQRFHPDNRETGNAERFRVLTDAYQILSDPERRAQYDVLYQEAQRERWRLVSQGEKSESDFAFEHVVRLTLLEALYTHRRMKPYDAGLFIRDLEEMIGRSTEQLEFALWYLRQKKFVSRDDNSRVIITADGADFLEKHYSSNLQRRRLQAGNPQGATKA
jgi:curved DNA-binding protein CbpA